MIFARVIECSGVSKSARRSGHGLNFTELFDCFLRIYLLNFLYGLVGEKRGKSASGATINK
ncbi:MAG: hypothetical protein ACKPKF_02240, partial [Microcystis panniformis]